MSKATPVDILLVNPVRQKRHTIECGGWEGAVKVLERMAKRHGVAVQHRRVAGVLVIVEVRVPDSVGYLYASAWRRVSGPYHTSAGAK